MVVFSVKPPFNTAAAAPADLAPAWQDRSIAGPKLRLTEFSAYLEQQRDPDSVSTHA